MSTTTTKQFRDTLDREAATYGVTLTAQALDRLSQYYDLLNQWNARVHLVAPCSPREFATRHVLESLVLIRYLPENVSLADVGPGGGLPTVPCLIVRPDLKATLIESSQKKAVFLREALSVGVVSSRASVINERFESIVAPSVDFVTCRALDHFEEMLPQLIDWSPVKSTLLLFGGEALEKQFEKLGMVFERELMPHSEGRYLFLARKL
jgi:16S rRNA (guanine527-N7)-methyltransferase